MTDQVLLYNPVSKVFSGTVKGGRIKGSRKLDIFGKLQAISKNE